MLLLGGVARVRGSQVKGLSSRRWAFCSLVLNRTQILVMTKRSYIKGLHKQEMKSHPASYHLLRVCVNFLYTMPFVLSSVSIHSYGNLLPTPQCTMHAYCDYQLYLLELFAFVAFAMLCIESRALHIVCCAT